MRKMMNNANNYPECTFRKLSSVEGRRIGRGEPVTISLPCAASTIGNRRPPSATLPLVATSPHVSGSLKLCSRFVKVEKPWCAGCDLEGEMARFRFRKIFGIGDFSVWVSTGVCERVLLQWSWWMAVLAALRRPEKCLMVEMEVEEDAEDDDGGLATLAFAFCIGDGGGYRRRRWCWVMARLRQDDRVDDGGLRLPMVLAAQGS
ncbi:uncharacterized protein HKW66_Vig0119930 [Vigna angularis]|uniref:Uncharacterized protein n=1 Tax=Phaseolus angularis TaxID=3914 RepID=A0A8T0JZ44_PHAAN|nr:uncharacterized protein HKW66_Vig0119930 [Vigna angularis]